MVNCNLIFHEFTSLNNDEQSIPRKNKEECYKHILHDDSFTEEERDLKIKRLIEKSLEQILKERVFSLEKRCLILEKSVPVTDLLL